MAYIRLDTNNIVTGKSINPDTGLIEAPDWVTCGMVKVGTDYIVPAKPESQLLAEAKIVASAAIDARAGVTRLKYITDVAGQAETYITKADDAAAYKAAGYPVASIADYKMVQAEGKALYGATPTAAQYQAAADGILTQQAQWVGLAAAIEQQRRAGKITVSGALTAGAALLAQQSAVTALAAL